MNRFWLNYRGAGVALVCVMSIGLLPTLSDAGYIASLDFNTDGVLPSATGQELTYGGAPGLESGAFSVFGGLLHVNTVQYSPVDVEAYYHKFPGGYDDSLPAEFRVRLRVLESGQFSTGAGFAVSFNSSSFIGNLTVWRGGWGLYNSTVTGTISDPDEFHEFRLRAEASTGAYDFFIDGSLVSSGTLPAGFPSANGDFYFGDGTPTGGNVRAEVDYLYYTNAPAEVPEPASIALFGMGGLGLIVARRRHSAAASCS